MTLEGLKFSIPLNLQFSFELSLLTVLYVLKIQSYFDLII